MKVVITNEGVKLIEPNDGRMFRRVVMFRCPDGERVTIDHSCLNPRIRYALKLAGYTPVSALRVRRRRLTGQQALL